MEGADRRKWGSFTLLVIVWLFKAGKIPMECFVMDIWGLDSLIHIFKCLFSSEKFCSDMKSVVARPSELLIHFWFILLFQWIQEVVFRESVLNCYRSKPSPKLFIILYRINLRKNARELVFCSVFIFCARK